MKEGKFDNGRLNSAFIIKMNVSIWQREIWKVISKIDYEIVCHLISNKSSIATCQLINL